MRLVPTLSERATLAESLFHTLHHAAAVSAFHTFSPASSSIP